VRIKCKRGRSVVFVRKQTTDFVTKNILNWNGIGDGNPELCSPILGRMWWCGGREEGVG